MFKGMFGRKIESDIDVTEHRVEGGPCGPKGMTPAGTWKKETLVGGQVHWTCAPNTKPAE